MLYLYLDETGDLCFDFVNKKPSKHFTITILVVRGVENNRALINSVKKTLKRKLNHKKSKEKIHELKGTNLSFENKQYFYKLVKEIPFSLFSITINKRKLYDRLVENKHRAYNYISKLVLEKIPIKEKEKQVIFIVDKSKAKKEIENFNDYIITHLQGRLDLNVPLQIEHKNSINEYCLQVVDVFSWGIYRKYEKQDDTWFNVYSSKVKTYDLYFK
ncbi:DUF3800 domain-containing protein [Thermoproteota archaeon]